MPITEIVTYMMLMDDYAGSEAYCGGCRGRIFFDSDFQPFLETKNLEYVMLNVGDIIRIGNKRVLLDRDDQR